MRHNPSSRRSWLPPAQRIEEPNGFSTLPSCHLFLHPIALSADPFGLGGDVHTVRLARAFDCSTTGLGHGGLCASRPSPVRGSGPRSRLLAGRLLRVGNSEYLDRL